MLTLFAATLLTANFPGGTPSEFAANLNASTKLGAIVCQGDPKPIKSFDYETTDLTELARTVRNGTGLSFQAGQDVVFSDLLIPKRFVVNGGPPGGRRGPQEQMYIAENGPAPSGYAVSKIAFPGTAIKAGKITFKTGKGESLDLSTLTSSFSKPVKLHWLFVDNVVGVDVVDVPEDEFLKRVAKGIGSKLTFTAKEYNLDLNSAEVRRRAINTITAIPIGGRTPAERNENTKAQQFRIACLNALTPAQLEEALKEPGSQVKIELGPKNSLTNLAAQRVREMGQYQDGLPAEEGAPRNRASLVLQRIDRSRVPYLYFNAQFQTEIEIPIVDQNGRSAGVVKF